MIGKYLALGALATMAAAGAAPAEPNSRAGGKGRDPNEVVCQKNEVIGSRLAQKKTCMTRAQWAEQRRLDRSEIDKVQTSRGSCEGCP